MNWRDSITVRLSLAFALLAILVFSALGTYLSRSADTHMAELDAHELLGKLALVRHVSRQEKSPAAMASRLQDALVGEHGVVLAVNGKNGPIFNWPPDIASADLGNITPDIGETPTRIHSGQRDFRIVAGELETGWGESARVIVARDIHHHTTFLDQLLRDFWIAVFAAFLLTVALGVLIAKRGLQPVRDIAHTAGRISVGQLAERIAMKDVPPELAEMVSAFNGMLGRLEASFARLSDFSADLAHELRTPIHTLRMQTEVSLGKERTVDEYRDLLASNLEEYERLAKMIADMLFLAKADHGLLMPHAEQIRLIPLCERLIEYYGLLAENVNLQLVGDDISIEGDRLMLERAIGNVLVNAIHHTPAAGSITVKISQNDGMAGILIENTGQPIPDEALNRVFDRFVRLDPGSEGSGLGLAIARSILAAHRGDITVSVSKQGTGFYLSLPRQLKTS